MDFQRFRDFHRGFVIFFFILQTNDTVLVIKVLILTSFVVYETREQEWNHKYLLKDLAKVA